MFKRIVEFMTLRWLWDRRKAPKKRFGRNVPKGRKAAKGRSRRSRR